MITFFSKPTGQDASIEEHVVEILLHELAEDEFGHLKFMDGRLILQIRLTIITGSLLHVPAKEDRI